MNEEIKGYGARAVRNGVLKDFTASKCSVASNFFVRSAIKKHITDNNVDLSDCMCANVNEYKSFADYFSRQMKPENRIADMSNDSLISPCDGWLSAHFINSFSLIPQGDCLYSVTKMLGEISVSNDYAEGMAIVITLDESDSHRFIFVDDGTICERMKFAAESGKKNSGLFGYRECTIFKTANFSTMAQIEICGSKKGIEQFDVRGNLMVEKGRDKGRFLCGGSAIVLLFKKGVIHPDDEFLVNTGAGRQTRVRMGEKIGIAISR